MKKFSLVKWTSLVLFFPFLALADTPATTTTALQTDQLLVTENTPQASQLKQVKVYFNQNVGVSLKPFPGGKEKLVPTNDEYQDKPGCYLSCYSKNAKAGVIPMGDQIYLMGQIRVQGKYANGLCLPTGYENKDVRSSTEFKDKCAQSFPEACQNNKCWAESNRSDMFD